MSLNITKSDQQIEVKNVVLLIYGQPGVGKSSIGFTAKNPLLLDFDEGAYRSEFRKDSVQVHAWEDVAGLEADDLADYDTIAVDTVGRLLDAMSAFLIKGNPKLGNKTGGLTLQGFGALKSTYASWLNVLRSYGKDIVLIAHDKEDKHGDDHIVRADITGGSYGEVFKRADGVGYMYIANRKRILDFNPSDHWVAKNAGGFEPLHIPHFTQEPLFLDTVIEQTKEKLNDMGAEAMQIMKLVDEWRLSIEKSTTAEDINGIITDTAKVAGPASVQIKHLIAARAKALELTYEGKKGEGQYVEKKAA